MNYPVFVALSAPARVAVHLPNRDQQTKFNKAAF